MARRNFVQTQPTNLSVAVNNKLKIKIDDLQQIEPLTENQNKFFQIYNRSNFIMLHGVSGTGKTYIALYKSLEQVLSKDTYSKVVIIRSAVPTREIGHLPGDEKEKCEVYEKPYFDICSELFYKKDAYQRLSEQSNIFFMTTSFIRGLTLDNSIMIVDECQNMTDMELNSIMTRVGKKTKIIFCGDFRQTDLYKRYDQSGLKKFMIITDMMPSAKTVEFDHEDIVRSKLVKEYIVARTCYEDMYETK